MYENKTTIIIYDSYVNSIYLYISFAENDVYDVQYIYNINNKKMDCLKGDCDKYKNYMEFMENSVKKFYAKVTQN